MGAFYTSIQIRTANLDEVIAALRQDAERIGMEEVRAGEPLPDRSVVVLPPDDGGWIAIYDQSTDAQNTQTLERIAELISRRLETYAMTVLVHDSDVLDLRLFRRGARVDHYSSDPGYFGQSASSAEALAGSPQEWTSLVRDGGTSELAAAFEERSADRSLVAIATLVRCHLSRVQTGYRYVMGDGELGKIPPFLEPRTLRFRSRERPPWEADAKGEPMLELRSYPSEPVQLAVGDELRVGVSVVNLGEASQGLRVTAWGDALERGLCTIDRFELLVGSPRARRHKNLTPRKAKDATGRTLWVAEDRDTPVPAGALDASMSRDSDPMAFFDAQLARQIHVNIVGRVVAPGQGELGVGFAPEENPNGSVGAAVALDASPRLRRPLRADWLNEMPGGSSHILRPLGEDSHWIALAPLDASRQEVAAIATVAIETLSALLPPVRVETAIYRREADARATLENENGPTLVRGKRLLSLVESMSTETTVYVRSIGEEREPGPAVLKAPGWTVMTGTGVLPDDDSQIPALAISVERASLDDAKRHETFKLLVSTMEQAMRKGALSASISLCGQGLSGAPDNTPYESACWIQGPITTHRSWCRRWIRFPGDEHLWLARPLVSRLDDEALLSLANVAEVTPFGDGGLAIRLRDREDLDALERSLAILLPSATDADEAKRKWYAERDG